MPIVADNFTIGLLVTALLEDRCNRTGRMRDETRRAGEAKLLSIGRVGGGRFLPIASRGTFEEMRSRDSPAPRFDGEQGVCYH